TLLVLIRHSGRLLEKEELMQAIWPDSFVEEVNLARNISVLRKALRREDGGPPYIETVPKCGYRFVGQVRVLAGGQDEVVVQTAKVSVVVEEEEESDGGADGQGSQATRRVGELVTERQPGLALERQPQPFGRLKRHKLAVALTVGLLMAAMAAAAY